MSPRLDTLIEVVRAAVVWPVRWLGEYLRESARGAADLLRRSRMRLLATGVIVGIAYMAWTHPLVQTVPRGTVVVRTNRFTGRAGSFADGSILVLPGVHLLRKFPVRDQVYRPDESSKANGESPFQSVEGLSLGVDLTVRYAIDPSRLTALARELPDDVVGDVVRPAVQGVIYRLFARYTVREIFSSKRAEIQAVIETELKPRLGANGILLRSVEMGKVDLPQDYRSGMDKLLAEELESEKMRFTLELKDKRVKEVALDGEADKVRREKAAEASAVEQVIAARAQEEAMKHVIPFKQRQIEQRRLEAEADKVARVRSAEGSAEARLIEAGGEADSRRKLTDAEVYRLERVGKANSEQMEREGVLITQHPLLIQKTLADKLSDKVQVIIAPPPVGGGFIGSTLLGAK